MATLFGENFHKNLVKSEKNFEQTANSDTVSTYQISFVQLVTDN